MFVGDMVVRKKSPMPKSPTKRASITIQVLYPYRSQIFMKQVFDSNSFPISFIIFLVVRLSDITPTNETMILAMKISRFKSFHPNLL
jgi:hypothetical protein